MLSLDRNLISAAQLAHYHFLSICNILWWIVLANCKVEILNSFALMEWTFHSIITINSQMIVLRLQDILSYFKDSLKIVWYSWENFCHWNSVFNQKERNIFTYQIYANTEYLITSLKKSVKNIPFMYWNTRWSMKVNVFRHKKILSYRRGGNL